MVLDMGLDIMIVSMRHGNVKLFSCQNLGIFFRFHCKLVY